VDSGHANSCTGQALNNFFHLLFKDLKSLVLQKHYGLTGTSFFYITLNTCIARLGTETWVGGWGLNKGRQSYSLQVVPMLVKEDYFGLVTFAGIAKRLNNSGKSWLLDLKHFDN
jgi:hypothetical protein